VKIFTFRNTSAFFIPGLALLTLLLLCCCFSDGICPSAIHGIVSGLLIFLALLYPGILLAMAFFPSSGFYFRDVITHGNSAGNSIALSLDDGPDTELTPPILDILRKHGVPAAFFIIGRKIRGNENIIRRITNEGHLLGNHSWSHSRLWDFRSAGRMAEDIERNKKEIMMLTGKKMALFRPPFGVLNPLVAAAVRKTGVRVVAWSFRSFDTNAKSPEDLLQKTIAEVKAGDILLFHDTSRITAGILEKLIVSLQERNFRFVSLDELINTRVYE
jgi:peptidoglycan-N-acetylglucosamine deacetylase